MILDEDDDNHFYIQQYKEVLHLIALPDAVLITTEPQGAELDLNQARSLVIQLEMAIKKAESIEWFENADGEMEWKEKGDV